MAVQPLRIDTMEQTNAPRYEAQFGTATSEATVLGTLTTLLLVAGIVLAASFPQLTAGVLIGLVALPVARRGTRFLLALRDRSVSTRRADSEGQRSAPHR